MGKKTEMLEPPLTLLRLDPAEEVIPSYKLGGSWVSYLNPSKYIRQAAELAVGLTGTKGSIKQIVLDEALGLLLFARDALEEKLGTLQWRLPGSDESIKSLARQAIGTAGTTQQLKSMATKVAGNIITGSTNAVVINNPINRPGKDKAGVYEVKDPGVSPGHGKSHSSKLTAKLFELGKKAVGMNQGLAKYTPAETYLDPNKGNGLSEIIGEEQGLQATLKHLCSGSAVVTSFEDLKLEMSKSDYMTTADRITKGPNRIMTLDSNHIWEIRFEPYLGLENGNRSMLPSIHQINYENYVNFGFCTSWDTWVPFTSFELSTRKMVQKSISLFSGEFSIPQNLEFTNELRMVICDDQYKSWKRYFNYVVSSSSFAMSTGTGASSMGPSYYGRKYIRTGNSVGGAFSEEDLLRYSRDTLRIAPYKNLVFRCRIFVMNQQYQTTHMSDLLVVLKEFMEDWQGDIDSSPTELSLMFSVVGENPIGAGKASKPVGEVAKKRPKRPWHLWEHEKVIEVVNEINENNGWLL